MDKRIGMIGAGNMATALVRGFIVSKLATADRIRASDLSQERRDAIAQAHGIQTNAKNAEIAAWADVVFLAVKPQVLRPVLAEVREAIDGDTIVISIAAGVSLATIEGELRPGTRVIRSMPNTPALSLAAATAIAAGAGATDADMDVARALFDSVGKTVVVAESQIDAVTGLSGSGPAYVMLIIEALADGGVKAGLPRDVAQLLAAQTVYGSAHLLLETGEHPGRLKDMVTSPGGTTIAGVYALESAGLRKALIEAVDRATQRAAELGKKA